MTSSAFLKPLVQHRYPSALTKINFFAYRAMASTVVCANASALVNMFKILPSSVLYNDVLLLLDAPSRLKMLVVTDNLFPHAFETHTAKGIRAKVQEIKYALEPLTELRVTYPGVDGTLYLDYEIADISSTRTPWHFLDSWGLGMLDSTQEVNVLDHLRPDLVHFQCPFCSWIIQNEAFPEVQEAVEVLLEMDTTYQLFEDIEPVILLTFSDPITGVSGSCAVRPPDMSEFSDFSDTSGWELL